VVLSGRERARARKRERTRKSSYTWRRHGLESMALILVSKSFLARYSFGETWLRALKRVKRAPHSNLGGRGESF